MISDQTPLTPEEARSVAEEAYIFAYPMLENYKTMQIQAIKPRAFNRFQHATTLAGPDDANIVRENNDTLYSGIWLDLRTEPMVITTPTIEDRYFSFQLVDLYTHNFAYVGTRETGTAGRTFMVASPWWKGPKPTGVDNLFRSEGNFVFCLGRTAVNSDIEGDLEKVLEIQQHYVAQPLSQFLGRAAPDPAPMDVFPTYDQALAESPDFIKYFNFLLGQLKIHPTEIELVERFGRIGVGPGFYFDVTDFRPSIQDAIQQGIDSAREQIRGSFLQLGEMKNSWVLTKRIFGSREQMQGQYLVRAGAAKLGLYGANLEEAYYPSVQYDDSGNGLDASVNRYVLSFSPGTLPPVKEAGFWSITIYSMPDQRMVHNPIDRYSIGDRTPGIHYGSGGSLEIYIQSQDPGGDRSANWLPAPSGPLSMTLRMYLPEEEALDPLYAPPGIRKDN